MEAISLKHKWPAVIGLCILIVCSCSCNSQLDLREAFNKVSEIDRFEMEEYESDRYGFPESFGEAKVCIHPNSSCRGKVLDVLAVLPQEWLELEVTVDGQLERFYITPDTTSDNLLFVHIGKGSGDTVLILFSNANLAEVQNVLDKIKKQTATVHCHNRLCRSPYGGGEHETRFFRLHTQTVD